MSIIEQIRAEVERQAKSIDTATGDFAEGRRMEQRIILSLLDTLQEQPVNIPPNQFDGVTYGMVGYGKQPVKVGDKVSIIKRKEGIVTRISDGKARVETGDTMEIVSLSELVAEQPVCEDMEKEAVSYCYDNGLNLSPRVAKDFARHFYALGQQSKPEVSEELEAYAQSIEDSHDVGEERGYLCAFRGDIKNAVIAGANWQKEKDDKETADLLAIAHLQGMEQQKEQDTREMIMSDGSYFQNCYELGKKDMKEQMMKEAVEGEIVGSVGTKQWVESNYLDNNIGKHGDKVKLIIIKEEGK